MLSRYTVFLVACALPLLLVGQIAPNMANQLDFWLLWFVAMCLVGLPVLFAEFALSARSGDGTWQGIQKLTREADASVLWRAFAGLSVLVSLLVAASMTTKVSGVTAYFPQLDVPVPAMGLSAGLMVVVLILSLLKARLLPVGLLLLMAGGIWALFDNSVSIPVMTDVSLSEWAYAVTLALVSVGAGSGLYWFTHQAMGISSPKMVLSKVILPVWWVQLIFGAFGLFVGSAMYAPVPFVIMAVGMLLLSAFLVYYAGVQLMVRFGWLIGGVATVVLSLVLSVLPMPVLTAALVITSLLAVLSLVVFAGFAMKISHLRKTFNFASEARYNVWRVLVRIIVPVSVALALAGWLLSWLA